MEGSSDLSSRTLTPIYLMGIVAARSNLCHALVSYFDLLKKRFPDARDTFIVQKGGYVS